MRWKEILMPNPKDKPAEQPETDKREEEKNLDRDGGNKQPNEQSESK